jgi:hypothetical protein
LGRLKQQNQEIKRKQEEEKARLPEKRKLRQLQEEEENRFRTEKKEDDEKWDESWREKLDEAEKRYRSVSKKLEELQNTVNYCNSLPDGQQGQRGNLEAWKIAKHDRDEAPLDREERAGEIRRLNEEREEERTTKNAARAREDAERASTGGQRRG